MNSFILDRAVNYVKTIADKCRCVSCDELKGLRVRYSCGHSVCENCVSTADDCLLCFSPPDVSTHVDDGPLNLRVEHASNLLNSFQKLFKLDVYRRQRISEQLQVEKQLFPECIQALSKYSNSKRISNISIQNKENVKRTLFPGENTSKTFSKMENKMSYVQQWLNKNETSLMESNYNLPRKPFTDINVNSQNVTRPKIANKVTKKKKARNENKIYLKSFNSDGKNKSKLSLTSVRKNVEMKIGKQQQIKCDQNESGIFIEDDIVIISETQSSDKNKDKDKEAWLAVIEACDDTTVSKFSKSEIEEVAHINPIDKPIQCKNMEPMHKVPFYKKSSLLKYANNQQDEIKNKEIIKSTSTTDNVTIKIESSGFVTTIQFYEELDSTKDGTKYSIGVQTEDQNNFKPNSDNLSKIVELKMPATENSNCNENNHNIKSDKSKNNNLESDDLFEEIASMEANQNHLLQSVNKPKGLLIDDSDSDSEILPTAKDSLLEVTAEVHRSETENDCSILSPLEQAEYEHRMRHAVRGHTPASTDSSDKENYDPNRAKRQKLDKKHCNKK